MQHYVQIEALLKAGAHFGHLTRRWNPKMDQFVFTERNGIHIIDLRKTQILLDIARDAIYDIATTGKPILFIGTKPQAKEIIEEQAKSASINYISERWLGGMLTNFSTIRKSIKRLSTIDKMEVDGTYENITKKERLMLQREKDRLRRVFGGIEDMTRLPGALVIVDIRKEHLAVKEAKILNIPIIAIVDTNTDPEQVDFPIPANDDSINTIQLILSLMSDAINEGTEISKTRMAELTANKDRSDKENEVRTDSDGRIQRKKRSRKKPDAPKKEVAPKADTPKEVAPKAVEKSEEKKEDK